MLRKLLIFIFIIFCLGTITYVLLDDNSITILSDTNSPKNIKLLNETKTYYFAYGSNMNIDLLRRRINNEDITPESYAILKNYNLIFPRGVGSVIQNTTTDVYGCLYLLTKEEISKLDVIEGYREDRDKMLNSYNREWIEVILPNGETILSEIYIQTNNLNINKKPSQSYKQTIVKGAKDCFLPDFYIENLKRINAE